MDHPESDGACYYSVLGIRKNASVADIRSAFRKLAMKWHPDRWTRDPTVVGEAKRRFQQIQEAYSVLSDEGKRAMYDVGLYDPFEEEDEGFADFMQEMLSMMDNVRAEKDSFEELQKMFVEMVGGDEAVKFGDGFDGKKRRVASDSSRRAGGSAPNRGTSQGNISSFGSGLGSFTTFDR